MLLKQEEIAELLGTIFSSGLIHISGYFQQQGGVLGQQLSSMLTRNLLTKHMMLTVISVSRNMKVTGLVSSKAHFYNIKRAVLFIA